MEAHVCSLKLTQAPPTEWLSQAGGKKTSFVAKLKLQSPNPAGLRLNAPIPVAATLVYAGSCKRVAEQKHFLLFRPVEVALDGTCEVQARYNDVSANHQKQAFALLLTPDAGACAQHGLSIAPIAIGAASGSLMDLYQRARIYSTIQAGKRIEGHVCISAFHPHTCASNN